MRRHGRRHRRAGLPRGVPWPVWANVLGEGLDGLLARGALVAAVQLVASFAVVWWALTAFGDLSSEMAEGETQALDDGVLAFLRGHDSPALDGAAGVVSLLGSEAVALLLVVLLLVWGWRRRWGPALSLLAVTGGAQLLNNALKDHFQRPRPAPVMGLIPAQHWSFPSGHAMVAAAFYLFLAVVAWDRLRGGWRVAGAVGLVGLVALIGWSRMYLGVHYLTDVVAGYCAGAGWVAAVLAAQRLLRMGRRWRRV